MEQTTPRIKSISVNFNIITIELFRKSFVSNPLSLSLNHLSFQLTFCYTLLFFLISLLSFPRFALSAVDMEEKDYDSRTALHVSSAEGDTIIYDSTVLPHNMYFTLSFTFGIQVWLIWFNLSGWRRCVDNRYVNASLVSCTNALPYIEVEFFLPVSSGNVEAVIFLTETCKVNPHIKDR